MEVQSHLITVDQVMVDQTALHSRQVYGQWSRVGDEAQRAHQAQQLKIQRQIAVCGDLIL